MTSKEFLTKIENYEYVRGLYLVRQNYLVSDLQINKSYVAYIWGFYPYEIEKIMFASSGRLLIKGIIVNKLGTTTGTKKDILSPKSQKIHFNSVFEFFETEAEAIEECHLRNLGKQIKNVFTQDFSNPNMLFPYQQVAPIYY